MAARGHSPHLDSQADRASSPGSTTVAYGGEGGATNIPIFQTKLRRGKFVATPGWHEVTLSATFALAVSSPFQGDLMMQEPFGHRASTMEAPKAQTFYHIEFKLFPDDSEPVKTDIVFYGHAAKIFPEKGEALPVKTWTSDDNTWIAWTQKFVVKVNNDLLLSLTSYQMTVRMWDSKEKCSSRARFDRPKPFRFPMPNPGQDPDSIGGVKSCILGVSRDFEKIPGSLLYNSRPLPSQTDDYDQQIHPQSPEPLNKKEKQEKKTSLQTTTAAPFNAMENCAVYSVTRLDPHSAQKGYGRLARLAGPGTPEPADRHRHPAIVRAAQRHQPSHPTQSTPGPQIESPSMNHSLTPQEDVASHRRSTGFSRSRRGKADPEQEHYDRFGRCSMTINMAQLFTRNSIIERLSDSVATVEDFFVSISTDKSLLSDTQKRDLNPLVIRIRSSKGMPPSPLSYEMLERTCEPVYCQYQFFNLPIHRTVSRPHGRDVYWDDIQIILTGMVDKAALCECMSGSAMTVEVHDRDKRSTADNLKPALFGDDLEDEKICNIGVVTSKRTAHSAFAGGLKSWDPYGVSKVSYHELLKGAKLVSLTLPISPCPMPDVLGTEKDQDSKIMGVAGAVDGPKEAPLHMGRYTESGAVLNVSLELTFPLAEAKTALQPIPNAFGRIIFKCLTKSESFLRKVESMIKQINGVAVGMSDAPEHAISSALRNYKIPFSQRSNPEFNLITGFHVVDNLRHMLVLEGPKGHCIQSLWVSLGRDNARDDVRILYNDDYTFAQRLYADLDVDISKIRIDESLEEITKQPLLYVRDMVPKACFDGITKLHQLAMCKTLQSAVTTDLFPTAEMITAVSREFGIPINIVGEQERLTEGDMKGLPRESQKETKYVAVSRWTRQVDNLNEDYIRSLREKQESGVPPNHILRNIRTVHIASAKLHQTRIQSCPVQRIHVEDGTAYNYSNQTLSASEKAKEEVRKRLNPSKRYTYNHRFNSATFVPVNVEKERKIATAESRGRWKTAEGWMYPGVKSATQSNRPAKQPGPSATQDLKQPWQENHIHTAIMQPTVPGRDPYSWKHRNNDFELYKRSKPVFGDEPHTIMPTGVAKEAEEREVARKETEVWLKKTVVGDIQFHSHRCLPQTELTMTGFHSSNQMERHRGLRKDSPEKFGLVEPGYQDPPSLYILDGPSPPERTRSFAPGEDPKRKSLQTSFLLRSDGQKGLKLVNRQHDPISLRHIKPLTSVERETHLFATPGQHRPIQVGH